MIDYSKMSDFEINKLVAKHLGKELMPDDCQDMAKAGFGDVIFRNGDMKDYCNSPADAWPIIVKYGISLTHDYGEWESEACLDLPVRAHGTDELCSVGGIDKNPLRAAMIAFLLLKDAEKC